MEEEGEEAADAGAACSVNRTVVECSQREWRRAGTSFGAWERAKLRAASIGDWTESESSTRAKWTSQVSRLRAFFHGLLSRMRRQRFCMSPELHRSVAAAADERQGAAISLPLDSTRLASTLLCLFVSAHQTRDYSRLIEERG